MEQKNKEFNYSPCVMNTANDQYYFTAIAINDAETNAPLGYIPVDNATPYDMLRIVFRDGNLEVANHLPYRLTHSATFLREVCKLLKSIDHAKLKLNTPGQIADGLYSIFEKNFLSNIINVSRYVSAKEGKTLQDAFDTVLNDFVDFERKEYDQSKSKNNKIDPREYEQKPNEKLKSGAIPPQVLEGCIIKPYKS